MAQQTLTFTSPDHVVNEFDWYTPTQQLNGVFFADGTPQEVFGIRINSSGRIAIILGGTGSEDLTNAIESSGEFVFTASNGASVTVIGITDMTEPYAWTPSNSAEVIAFYNAIDGLSNQTLTFRIDDDPVVPVVPTIPTLSFPSTGITSSSFIVFLDSVGADTCQVRYRIDGTFTWTTLSPSADIGQNITGLSSGTQYDVQGQCANSTGNSGWSSTYTVTTLVGLSAPEFIIDAGSSQNWTQGTAITPITVPAASGNPAPTYATVGSVPSGIGFNTSSRVISGTPSSVGSGTIRIRASNSEGDDDWTVAYTITAAGAPDLTVDTPISNPASPLEPGQSFILSTTVRNIGETNSPSTTTLRWRRSNDASISTSDQQIGTDGVSALAGGASGQESISVSAPSTPGTYYYGATVDSVSGEGDTTNNASGALPIVVQAVAVTAPDLTVDTPTVSPSGTLEPGESFTLSTVVRNGGNANSPSTTLRWRQSTNNNITESDSEVGTDSVSALSPNGSSNESVSLTAPSSPGTYYYGATVDTVTDESDTGNNASNAVTIVVATALSAPNFSDDIGDAQSWIQGQQITPITVPAANGLPTPTYSIVGNPPSGIGFNTSSRVISGTPSNIGSGTIRIRASNSEGDDDWTVDYTTTPTNVDPVADAGNNQSVAAGASVSLDGTGSSDSDGNIVSYSWVQTVGDNVALTDANTSTPDFTAPSTDIAQTLTFRLTVTDDDGATDTDDVNVNVAATVAPPPPSGDETRLDTIHDLESLFTRFDIGLDQGAWIVDPTGTTTSSGTGPGTNSEGPYVYSESSGSDDNLPNISTLTALASVMTAWTGLGRMLLLRACIQGSGSYPNDSASGLQIQGRASSSDPWTLIDLLEGWAYDTNYVVGNTVTDSLGVTQTIVQDGGWVDFAVLIPDNITQLRIRNIPAMGASAFTHDAALWHAEFRNGSQTPTNPPTVTITTASGMEVASGTVVALAATSSDPDNQNLTHLWEAFELNDYLDNANPVPRGMFSDNTTRNTMWTAPTVSASTAYAIILTVTDTDGLTADDSITIRVIPTTVNTDPLASAGSDQSVAAGTLVTLDGTGSVDPDGTIDTYAWVQTAGDNVVLSDADTSTPDFTAPSTSSAQVLTFQLTVTDNGGATDTDSVNVNVAAAIAPAQVITTAITSTPIALSDTYGVGEVIRITVTYDEAVTVNTSGGTPDLRANIGSVPGLTSFGYVGSSGAALNFEYTVLAADMDDNGIFLFGATDSQNRGDIRLNGATIQANGVNVSLTTTDRGTEDDHKVNGTLGAPTAPEFTNDTGTPQTWTQGVAIAPITVPSAGGNPAPDYLLIGNAPTGINFNVTSRVISGTPTEIGNGTIRIRASNSEGSDDWTVDYSVMADIPDLALPVINNFSREQNTVVSITLPEATGGSSPITYSLTGLPSTLAFDADTRTFTGTPTAIAGYNLTYTATDSNNDIVFRTFTLAITAGSVTPPGILPAPVFVDYVGPWLDGDAGNPPNSNRTSLQVVGMLPAESMAHENVQFLVTSTGDIYRGTDTPSWQRVFVNGLIGEIKDYGGATTPAGYLWCDGGEYSRTLYPDLFAAIGTLWGNGNGVTTFNVPDARGYVTMGRGQTRGPVGLGVGNKGGTSDEVLSILHLPNHKHDDVHELLSGFTGNSTGGPDSRGLIATNNLIDIQDLVFNSVVPAYLTQGYYERNVGGNPQQELADLIRNTPGFTGVGGPHNNIQPTATVNKVIRY